MTGKYFIALVFLFAAIVTCQSTPIVQTVVKDSDVIIKPNQVEAIFNSRDTIYAGQSVACVGSFYTIIDKYMVVMLQHTMPIIYDSCIYIKIDSTNSPQLANLYLYKNGNANLNNFATDGITEADTSSSVITKAYGDIILKFQQEKSPYFDEPLASIYIDNLHFIDTTNNKIISIKNKLIWKVQDWPDCGG